MKLWRQSCCYNTVFVFHIGRCTFTVKTVENISAEIKTNWLNMNKICVMNKMDTKYFWIFGFICLGLHVSMVTHMSRITLVSMITLFNDYTYLNDYTCINDYTWQWLHVSRITHVNNCTSLITHGNDYTCVIDYTCVNDYRCQAYLS